MLFTAADDNAFQHEELLVGDEVGDHLVVTEDLDVDPDERGQQEQVEQQHEGGAASSVAQLPHGRHDEKRVKQNHCYAADEPHNDELVQLYASGARKHKHTHTRSTIEVKVNGKVNFRKL